MKKMMIIWVVIAIGLVGTLTFIGLQFQESVKEYRTYESDIIESAQIYMEVTGMDLDVSESLKLDIDKLIEDKYLDSNEVGEDTCTGHVTVKKTFDGLEYIPYIKCKEYETKDNE